MTNLAVKYKKQQSQNHVQSQAPQQTVQVNAKTKITKFEKIMYAVFVAFLLYTCVAFIGNKATLYEFDAKKSSVEKEIAAQKKTNQELQAEVENLSRYERIEEIAKKHGLEINADNVKGLQ